MWNTGKNKKSLYVQDLTLSQKKKFIAKKKLLANFFDRVHTWTYLKKERKRTEEKPYNQTEKEGFEKILLLKSQTQVKTLYCCFLVAL